MDNFENWKQLLHESFKITMYGCDDDNKYQQASDMFDKSLNEALLVNNSMYAQELISLFCDDEDYGTLESCFRILSNMDRDQVRIALKEQEDNLFKNSKFWYKELKTL